jgi:CDP-diacylglycerol--glycerol-3-phosphate 3-phosphatidyltransferase
MNLPNLLTLSRIPFTFVIAWLLYAEWFGAASLAFVLFIVSGVTDWLDGWLARRQGLVSHFGIFMDALSDKIAVLGVLIVLTVRGLILPTVEWVPVTMLLIILTREFLITGMRLVAATKGVVVSAERGGKQKTLTQIVAIGVFLFIHVLDTDLNRITPMDLHRLATEVLIYLGFGLYLLATAFTVSSGVRYFVKYRHIFAETQP